jgi:uncharacterized membrane protein
MADQERRFATVTDASSGIGYQTELILGWEDAEFDWRAQPPLPPGERARRAATGLGIFALGLGLAELIAPRPLGRLIGVGQRGWRSWLLRGFGLRELVTGLGVLGRRRPTPWLWARVAGDVVDLAMLALACRGRQARPTRTLPALAAVAGVTALDVYAAALAGRATSVRYQGPVRRSITIAVSADRAYQYWRNLEHLPNFMQRVEAVEVVDGWRSKWRARGPAGRRIEWQADIVEDVPGKLIRWRSVEGSPVTHRGEVNFRPAPSGRGTEVAVTLEYVAPAGEIGRALAFTSNEALRIQLGRDLHQLKQLLELGELIHSDASAHRGRHPARPGALSRR